MDHFDLIVMLTGGILIGVGLLLFIFGRRDGNKNYLEGFGIKLDVSNPSILLIVVGVGLLLVPRLLPANKPGMGTGAETSQPLDPQVNATTPAQSPANERSLQDQQSGEASAPSVGNTAVPDNPALYLPRGYWQLSGYQEAGIDVPGVGGDIRFSRQSDAAVQWAANLIFMDIWGNTSNYRYQGVINADNGSYLMSLTSSNDPNFVSQSNVPLELLLENGEVLHLRYLYQGTEILLHFAGGPSGGSP
ncbi:hypothetical protein [Bowmanella dokdonensis]|uniref:Uncharacterized protein n=1 Tax=Bowmanella dokdonensis TaxID=751969 RepID=A0A939DK15_9ALTE|nr:hypothetical protein [Bowmanella dokdonensis]MBN7823985.1 hypothetical protein [Bowmanella dokdonensis]